MSYKTNITIDRRKRLQNALDEFATFSWGTSEDAFTRFGAFIINKNREDLKFYNGPSFTNEYTKPQFDQSGGSLQGVTFNKQTISFTIGIYWFSIEEYRKILNWLSPYRVADLIFYANPRYRYNVKLSKLGDSTRYIIGKENGEPRYYTEIPLTFELQGTPCAKGVNSYDFVSELTSSPNNITKTTFLKTDKEGNPLKDFIESDLPTPFESSFNFNFNSNIKPTNVNYSIKYQYGTEENEYEEMNLFSISFNSNAVFTTTEDVSLKFRYNSETGLMFVGFGGSDEKLLSTQTTTDTGESLLTKCDVKKFFLPGRFAVQNFETKNVKFILSVDIEKAQAEIEDEDFNLLISADNDKDREILCYQRTNVI